MKVKWGMSVLDWRAHTINEDRVHPSGMFQAECGHPLMTVTTPRETPCGHKPCEACGATVTPGDTAAPP